MKVLYDFQCFTNDRIGGISKYFARLIQYLDKKQEIDVEITGRFSNNLYSREFQGHLKHKDFLSAVNFPGQRKLLKQINRLSATEALKKTSFDIFHPTYYHPYWLDQTGNRKVVLTVHDMIHELFHINEYFGKTAIAEAKRKLIERADRVIAISNSTRNDILNFINVPPDKIEVIYHGVDDLFVQRTRKGTDFQGGDYILFVGRRSGYKNFAFMIRAISEYLLRRKINIVCVGGGPFSNEETALLKELKLPGLVHNFPIVSEESLDYYYQNAVALIYPSLYEGFGMPVLEAARNHCPVILANASSLPEVGGDAALYFETGDAASLEHAVEQVAEDQVLRDGLVQKGLDRVKSFSWERTFEKTEDVYKSVA